MLNLRVWLLLFIALLCMYLLSTGLNLFSANLMPARRKPYALSSKKQLPKLFWWQKSLLCKNETVGIWRRKCYIVLLYTMQSDVMEQVNKVTYERKKNKVTYSTCQKRPNIQWRSPDDYTLILLGFVTWNTIMVIELHFTVLQM